ncbi:MAG: hypothetical protein AAFZ65_17280 [Planctomycetota bacterium]
MALQGAWSRPNLAGAWTPEVGVVLMIGLASRMTPERARGGAVILALVRSALSTEPLFATLVAYLLLGELVAALRAAVDTEGAALRTVLAFAGSIAVVVWFGAVHGAREGTPAPLAFGLADRVAPTAVSTALVALALGGWLRRLPGIGPLWKKELPWGVAAPVR